jgi:hypothetical protein
VNRDRRDCSATRIHGVAERRDNPRILRHIGIELVAQYPRGLEPENTCKT